MWQGWTSWSYVHQDLQSYTWEKGIIKQALMCQYQFFIWIPWKKPTECTFFFFFLLDTGAQFSIINKQIVEKEKWGRLSFSVHQPHNNLTLPLW